MTNEDINHITDTITKLQAMVTEAKHITLSLYAQVRAGEVKRILVSTIWKGNVTDLYWMERADLYGFLAGEQDGNCESSFRRDTEYVIELIKEHYNRVLFIDEILADLA